MPYPRISSGELRRRISLEEPTRSADQYGDTPISWSWVADLWAKVEPLSGRELQIAAQVQPDVTHKVTIRFRRGLTCDMRFNVRGKVLNILSILNIEERDERMECLCQEFAE